MIPNSNEPADKIALRVPVIMLVLAATAVPVQLHPLRGAAAAFSVDASDVLANILGYVPVGIVLGGLGPIRAILAAALMATFAETGQIVMEHRVPSVIDVVSNTLGAILGTVVSVYWGIRSPVVRISKWKALIALMVSFVLVFRVSANSGDPVSTRGTTSPGTLEAYWKFDESGGRNAVDSSGHALQGRFFNETKRTAGVRGGAVTLNGAKDYIDFGHSTALRLAGSMTITAWINSSSFPVDDAVIVSQHRQDAGYQLDTTVDRGPRTIGFKLIDPCGKLMARYGATPLALNTWYHVAGVYDADAQTLDVYLNGQLDNGFLLGHVSSGQRSSRLNVCVGRRGDSEGFNFAGSIDEVCIYSFTLTQDEIAAVMDGQAIQPSNLRNAGLSHAVSRPGDRGGSCEALSEFEDAATPGAAGALGVLVAVACVGLWPSVKSLHCVLISLISGLLLIPATASSLPSFNLWALPLLSFAGGVSVAVSRRPSSK